MSTLDALLGKIFNDGVEIELGGGIDFIGNTTVAFNDTTKRAEVSLLSTAAVLINTDIKTSPSTYEASTFELVRHDGSGAITIKPTDAPVDGELFGILETAGGIGTITVDGNGKLIGNPYNIARGTPESSFTTAEKYFGAVWQFVGAADQWLLIYTFIPSLLGGSSGGGLTLVAQRADSYTAVAGERQLFDPSGGSRTVTAPSSPSPNLGDEFAIKINVDDVTQFTIAGGGNDIENPLGSGFASTQTAGGQSDDYHYTFDGAKWVLI